MFLSQKKNKNQNSGELPKNRQVIINSYDSTSKPILLSLWGNILGFISSFEGQGGFKVAGCSGAIVIADWLLLRSSGCVAGSQATDKIGSRGPIAALSTQASPFKSVVHRVLPPESTPAKAP